MPAAHRPTQDLLRLFSPTRQIALPAFLRRNYRPAEAVKAKLDCSLYFFTQAFVASSHFMSFIFSHSTFVFGASAANAGAAAATTRAATIAVLRILNDI